MCGENALQAMPVPRGVGSPPRVRGKRPASHARTTRRRITPACAGKTIGLKGRPVYVGDHPRVCGENKKGQ